MLEKLLVALEGERGDEGAVKAAASGVAESRFLCAAIRKAHRASMVLGDGVRREVVATLAATAE